jgi:lysozyme
MNISQAGIDMIKKAEGCILHCYKDSVGVPTIGYGHTGGVYLGQTISQQKAEDLLKQDLQKFVGYVNALGLKLNQNQFDALVSFSFNLGNGNLKELVNGRSLSQIADVIPQYCHAGGEVLDGLVKRRAAEKALFLKPVPVVHPYPGHVIKQGSTNTIAVKLIQAKVGVTVDGVFGPKSTAAVKTFQKKHGLVADGLIGPASWQKLFN